MEEIVVADDYLYADLLNLVLCYYCSHVYIRTALYEETAARMGTPLVCKCHYRSSDSHFNLTVSEGYVDEEES